MYQMKEREMRRSVNRVLAGFLAVAMMLGVTPSTLWAETLTYEQENQNNMDTVGEVIPNEEIISIAEARELVKGTEVTLEGVVTRIFQGNGTTTNNSTVYIQDETAGIAMYMYYTFELGDYAVGTKLQVTGQMSAYNDVIQIQPSSLDDIVVLTGEEETLEPEVITIDELKTLKYEGQLVKVVGAKLDTVATNSNHIIKDIYTGASTTMRCTGALTLVDFKEGDTIDVIGVAANYNGDPQLMVSVEADITLGEEATVAAVTASPGNGSQVPLGTEITLSTVTPDATINYRFEEGTAGTIDSNEGIVTISSFNEQGKAVITATASKDGYTTPEFVFEYTQAKVDTVRPSTQPGSVNADSQVELTTATLNAIISYQLTTNVGPETEAVSEELTYSEAITLTAEMFPVKITTWAVADNYLDSDVSELNYRLREIGRASCRERVYVLV